MAYAVLMQVKLAGDPVEGLKLLHEVVVPQAKSQPGFQRGTWMRNQEGTGTGIIVFDSEDNAKAAEKALQPPPGGPTPISSTVFSIEAEA